MATIQPYIAKSVREGQKQTLKARKIVWINVGQGEVTKLDDYRVAVAGKIGFAGYNGDLNIDLALQDKDPQASSGTARLQLNSHVDESASYFLRGGVLMVDAVLGGKKQSISLQRCNDGQQTEVQLSGHVNQLVHLVPQ